MDPACWANQGRWNNASFTWHRVAPHVLLVIIPKIMRDFVHGLATWKKGSPSQFISITLIYCWQYMVGFTLFENKIFKSWTFWYFWCLLIPKFNSNPHQIDWSLDEFLSLLLDVIRASRAARPRNLFPISIISDHKTFPHTTFQLAKVTIANLFPCSLPVHNTETVGFGAWREMIPD